MKKHTTFFAIFLIVSTFSFFNYFHTGGILYPVSEILPDAPTINSRIAPTDLKRQTTLSAEVYFSPSADCEEKIIDRINKTQKKLYIAVYSLTSVPLTNAILNAHQRGIDVKILTDRTQAGTKNSKVRFLNQKGLNIKVHSRHNIMHDKIAIFDEQTFLTGSYNWSTKARRSNVDNCLFISGEPNVNKAVLAEFEKLWHENSLEKHKIWIRKGTLK